MSNRTAVSAEQNPYEVLQNRNFLFFLAGRFIASFGQQMVSVAVGWELYERTHSALALGFVGLTQMIPMFAFTLPAGHVADNHDRKKVILLMIAIMAAASFGLALSSWHQSPVGWMYFWLFVSGAARTFVWPTSAAWLPQLVPRRIFSRAVTWNTSAFHLSSVIGPAAGGGQTDDDVKSSLPPGGHRKDSRGGEGDRDREAPYDEEPGALRMEDMDPPESADR